jgi:hypothetical protein
MEKMEKNIYYLFLVILILLIMFTIISMFSQYKDIPLKETKCYDDRGNEIVGATCLKTIPCSYFLPKLNPTNYFIKDCREHIWKKQ